MKTFMDFCVPIRDQIIWYLNRKKMSQVSKEMKQDFILQRWRNNNTRDVDKE